MVAEIRAQVMGTVNGFYCDDGAMVEANDPVVGIEVMKMTIEHRSPAAGEVEFAVELGVVVDKDSLLALIKED